VVEKYVSAPPPIITTGRTQGARSKGVHGTGDEWKGAHQITEYRRYAPGRSNLKQARGILSCCPQSNTHFGYQQDSGESLLEMIGDNCKSGICMSSWLFWPFFCVCWWKEVGEFEAGNLLVGFKTVSWMLPIGQSGPIQPMLILSKGHHVSSRPEALARAFQFCTNTFQMPSTISTLGPELYNRQS
jgi:hypothetical protein